MGILTWKVRVRRWLPLPPHVGHGVSTTRPEPRQTGQVWLIWNGPWLTATAPEPPHRGQVVGLVPGAAPLP